MDVTGLERPSVTLIGENGNAFAIMGKVQRACRKAKWPEHKVQELLDEMKSGDYDNLLATAMEYCDVD